MVIPFDENHWFQFFPTLEIINLVIYIINDLGIKFLKINQVDLQIGWFSQM
jgi:hypothetical protein